MKVLTLPLVLLFISLSVEGKTFDFVSVEFGNSQLIFKTLNERDTYPFYVDRWINESWVTVSEIYGKGGIDTNTYKISIETLFYGMNKFRIKKETGWEYYVFSNPLSFFHKNDKIYPFVEDHKILFSDTAFYRLETRDGGYINRGYSSSLDVSQLDKGTYTLWYNNRKTFFRKKRSKIVLKNKL